MKISIPFLVTMVWYKKFASLSTTTNTNLKHTCGSKPFSSNKRIDGCWGICGIAVTDGPGIECVDSDTSFVSLKMIINLNAL